MVGAEVELIITVRWFESSAEGLIHDARADLGSLKVTLFALGSSSLGGGGWHKVLKPKVGKARTDVKESECRGGNSSSEELLVTGGKPLRISDLFLILEQKTSGASASELDSLSVLRRLGGLTTIIAAISGMASISSTTLLRDAGSLGSVTLGR